MDFPYSLVNQDRAVVLRIGGYIDRRGIKQLRETLLEEYANGNKPIIVNFSNGEPNSLLVAIFFEILDINNKDPRKIAFSNLNEPIHRALEATGILSLCAVFSDENEALERLQ
ncbi:MAG: STAS domain-containing protein [Candidatus Marinimicrobia bacterium]|nr:STAS domain-containing protein [Candidatus Neomarinimicrobiota bacterium]MCF7901963.1 STAS domain-containing protein [Candidatus Neomarinimicrobiota bacterium]